MIDMSSLRNIRPNTKGQAALVATLGALVTFLGMLLFPTLLGALCILAGLPALGYYAAWFYRLSNEGDRRG